jgi:hypothetical protein
MALVFFCLILVEGSPDFFVKGNPMEPERISVILLSPENKSYSPDSLRLTFRVSHWLDANIDTWYTLDDQAPTKLYLSSYQGSVGSSQYDSVISGLDSGSHVIKICVSGSEGVSEARVFFTIDSTAPAIQNLSIKNMTYTETTLELNCTTNEPFSWIAYCLDNQANVTIKNVPYYIYALGGRISEAMRGNITLGDLTEGHHSLIIYANDTAGNMGASETILFTVEKPESFPGTAAMIVIASTGVIVIFAGSLIAYRKHRKIR